MFALDASIGPSRNSELPLQPKLAVGARFAYVTMNGRTEAPVMRRVRQLVAQHLAACATGVV